MQLRLLLFPALALLLGSSALTAPQGVTTHVSVSSSGAPAQGPGGAATFFRSDISGPGGRYVAFNHDGAGLVPGTPPGVVQIYRHDRVTGETTLVSRSSDGVPANDHSFKPAISEDGRFIAFYSSSTNLLPGVSGMQIYRHDALSGATVLVSRDPAGQPGDSLFTVSPAISADGQRISYRSRSGNILSMPTFTYSQILVFDFATGLTTLASRGTAGEPANWECFGHAICEQGRYVVFDTTADNVVPNITNGTVDAFLHDLSTDETVRVSITNGPNGDEVPTGNSAGTVAVTSLLPGGAVAVVFGLNAPALWGGPPSGGHPGPQVILRRMDTHQNELVSVAMDGSGANNTSFTGSISSGGRYVSFTSYGTNLVAEDTQGLGHAYVRDLHLGTTTWVSVSTLGQGANASAEVSPMSRDGAAVSFRSRATNLVPGTDNGLNDCFVHDREGAIATVAFYCSSQVNSQGCAPVLSTEGTPRASGVDEFWIHADGVLPGVTGIFFYGHSGPVELPFGAGTLCVKPPLTRTQPATATGGGACGGRLSVELNAPLASPGSPSQPGDTLWGQWWSRDPGGTPPADVNLSGGTWFTVLH